MTMENHTGKETLTTQIPPFLQTLHDTNFKLMATRLAKETKRTEGTDGTQHF
jgi:hypothetical protein